MRTRALPALGAALVVALVVAVLAALAVGLGERLPELTGPSEECSEIDPTASGDDPRACLTPTAARVYDAVVDRFGEPGRGEPVRSATCWSEHAWNPGSDHPEGRACDVFPGRYGAFADGDDLRRGWEIAQWLRDDAETLGVRYVIWQGRIWTRGGGDTGGWGRPYGGGGVYDPDDATGGHFDHVHVSVRG